MFLLARQSGFRFVLLLAGIIYSSLLYASDPAWNNLKQLSPGQQIRVVLNDKKSIKGQFQSVTDDVLVVEAHGSEQSLSRDRVQKVALHREGHRGRHILIGAAIGAGAGLGTGAAIDSDCSSSSFFCTGNKGKAILTPVFALIGAGIGAALPARGWQEIYPAH